MGCYENDKARQRKLVKVILFYLLTFFNKKQWIDNNQTLKGFAVTDLTPEFIYCLNFAIKRGCFTSQWLPGRRALLVSMHSRSAGACPPRPPSSGGGVLGPLGSKRTRDVFCVARTMARDRPSPYGEVPFFSRRAWACPPRALECADDGEGLARMHVWKPARALAIREGAAFFPVARGPVPAMLSDL